MLNLSINRMQLAIGGLGGQTRPQPTFVLPFQDLGAGEVSLVPDRGGVSATFTRATTATTVNSAGLIVSVSSGVARSYYDPTTLQYLGYLAEGARTNLLLNSLLNGTSLSTQAVNCSAVAHTLSFYGTGTVTLTGASTAGPLVGTGAYPQRVSLTFTPSAGSVTFTVSGSVQFAQLEVGSFPSSFIPTAGASVTRNADSLTYPLTGWYNAAAGTIVSTAQSFHSSGGHITVFDDTTDQEVIRVLMETTTLASQFIVTDGGASPVSMSTANGNTVNTTGKYGAAYELNNFATVLNGGTPMTDTGGTIPTVTRLTVGVPRAGSTAQLFGTISRTSYYATRLPDGVLQQITA